MNVGKKSHRKKIHEKKTKKKSHRKKATEKSQIKINKYIKKNIIKVLNNYF